MITALISTGIWFSIACGVAGLVALVRLVRILWGE
jgi:hypothetical protein